jgi:hypothetical protein
MNVGALGKIVFTVSHSQIETLRNLEITAAANINVHNVHGGAGLAEFDGADPQKITFKLRLSAYLGVNPETELKKLDSYLTNGTVVAFVLGGKSYGRYRWLVEKYQASAEYFDSKGNVTQFDVSVSLLEYLKKG